MNFLGICNANDSGAAIIKDGKLIAAVNEERFIRSKLTRKFPINSIKYVLKEAELKIEHIDFIGCGAWKGIDFKETLPILNQDQLKKNKQGSYSQLKAKERIQASKKVDFAIKNRLLEDCKKNGIPLEKIIFCDHHLSHALVAFYPSKFEEAVILVSDGRGDFRSTSLWIADRENGLKNIHTVSELNSVGAMYGYMTKILGYTPDRHEGKLTGLSARGKHTDLCNYLDKSIWFDKNTGQIETIYGDYYLPHIRADLPNLKKLLKNFSKEDFAFAAQFILEKVLIDYLTYYLKKEFPKRKINLCLSGGCSANVKLNFEINKIPQINEIYVSPAMGDGGNALGGAINCMIENSNQKKLDMKTVYLGPKFDQDTIIKVCNKYKLKHEILSADQKIDLAANFLNQEKIIGWFQGRMEYGPRALGARSILASPQDNNINNFLNKRLNRTEFMPFAPVTIDELAPICFENWNDQAECSRFMTTCYQCTPLMSEKCPATVHIDNTARPQVVRYDDNPDYHELIKRYYKISGRPALINTSFNHHEEPIVCSPEDAVRSFEKGNVDILFMENIMIKAF